VEEAPAFPYKEFRRGQAELAEAVADTVRKGGVLAVRAPTGFGKTAAIIYGLLRGGAEKVLYMVRTVNEVDPVVRELKRFGVPFTFIFSARRSCPLMGGQSGLPPEDFWENCRLARVQGVCEYYPRVEGVEPGEIIGYVMRHPSSHGLRIARSLAEELRVCPFFSLRRAVEEARFIVATYPYLFRRDIFEGVLDPYGYDDFVVVVDEAHTLVNAYSLLEQRLRLGDVEKSVEEIRSLLEARAGDAPEMLERLAEALRRLTPRRLRQPTRLEKQELSEVLEELPMLVDVAEEVRTAKFEQAILRYGPLGVGKVRTWTTRVVNWLSVLAMEESFLFADPGDEETIYVATPLDPAVVAKAPLEGAKAVVLASGTLPQGDFVREALGVERETVYIDTDLMYGRFISPRNIYAAVARDVTTRYRERNSQMYRRIAAYVASIQAGLPGYKLIVYPSYEVMREIVGRLPVEAPVIVESRGTSLEDVEEAIRALPNAGIHAVASGKLVEGVEFTGEEGRNVLQTVVMVGVPYPQPDDYTRTAIEVLARRLGERRAKYYVYEFETIVRIKQALGRAIRSPEDRAVYFFLDYRYLRKELRHQVGVPFRRVIGGPEGLARALAEARAHLGYSSSSTNDSIAS